MPTLTIKLKLSIFEQSQLHEKLFEVLEEFPGGGVQDNDLHAVFPNNADGALKGIFVLSVKDQEDDWLDYVLEQSLVENAYIAPLRSIK